MVDIRPMTSLDDARQCITAASETALTTHPSGLAIKSVKSECFTDSTR